MREMLIIGFKFSLLMLMATSVYAQDHIRLKNEAFKEKVIIKEDGSKETILEAPGIAIPGDEIIYITTFTNIGDKEVTGIVVTNPIPNNSLYKAGSAFGSGTEITYSADDGETYAKASELKVKDKNGSLRTATPKDYTTIKWKFINVLKPGAESTVTFRTIID